MRHVVPTSHPWRRAITPVPLLVLTVLLAAACATPAPMPPPAKPAEATYKVGSPDTLFVSILPAPTLERTVVVRPDGKISIDLIGDVQAAGRTTEEIASEIETRVRRFKRDARATVSIKASASLSVTVLGEVAAPGTFPLTSETRLSEAIGLRGGTSIFASKRNVRLVRTNGQITRVFTIDLARIEQGDLTENIMVRGGDMVIVPPNALAKVGYGLQVMLFPFQQLLSAGTGAAAAAAIF
jgi:polysaccharide export outer membrane protein